MRFFYSSLLFQFLLCSFSWFQPLLFCNIFLFLPVFISLSCVSAVFFSSSSSVQSFLCFSPFSLYFSIFSSSFLAADFLAAPAAAFFGGGAVMDRWDDVVVICEQSLCTGWLELHGQICSCFLFQFSLSSSHLSFSFFFADFSFASSHLFSLLYFLNCCRFLF